MTGLPEQKLPLVLRANEAHISCAQVHAPWRGAAPTVRDCSAPRLQRVDPERDRRGGAAAGGELQEEEEGEETLMENHAAR